MSEQIKPSAPRAAIITMHRVGNYGSVLQSVATKKLLEGFGLEVEFIDYWRPDQVDPARWAAEHSRFVKGPITRRIQALSSREYFSRFAQVFGSFVEENLPLTRRYISIDELRNDPPKADLYVVGSDQVWNTDYNIGGTEPYLLDFGSEAIPRISLSSSIGKHPITEQDGELFQSTLPRFSWRSVREESARQDLARIGIGAEVIADPTLLLPVEEWRELAGFQKQQREFAVLYTLNRGTGIRKIANSVSKDLGLPLVTLNPRPLPWVRYRNEYRVPEVPVFLELLSTASHVITDSFHASAFSLNLGTPLTVSMPPKYSGRLEGILQLTGTVTRNFTNPEYTPRESEQLVASAQQVLAAQRDAGLARIEQVVEKLKGGNK